jgi:phosphoglucosamine mutase
VLSTVAGGVKYADMKRYFGTDGVRGVAGKDLTADMARILGTTAVELLGRRLIIGRDTRLSGDMLQEALVMGITAARGEALLAGVIPTPAVALLTRQLGADGGIVISASHNPPEYNGIKFFDSQGYKLSAEMESQFESRLQLSLKKTANLKGASTVPRRSACSAPDSSSQTANAVQVITDGHERYIHHATTILVQRDIDLRGIKVAVDCGNGAAFATTPAALRRLGAEVVAINSDGDGRVINVQSGSTHLGQLQRLVERIGADLGIAHDGDADRVIAVDAGGQPIDGDFIVAICALDLKARGELAHNTVVSTVMCNFGFTQAMSKAGIHVIQTPVGDANVLKELCQGQYVLGGEQSGHVIFLRHNTTGDGLITALMLMAAMRQSGQPLAHLAAAAMTSCPQELVNVKVGDKAKLTNNATIAAAQAAAEHTLLQAGGGRVLIRASGTEPLVRVMVEAPTATTARQQAQALAALVAQELA